MALGARQTLKNLFDEVLAKRRILNMCLGIPMRVKKIRGDFAEVESGRLIRNINIQMLERLEIGDYVIVHAGFAIKKLDENLAKETLRLINEIH